MRKVAILLSQNYKAGPTMGQSSDTKRLPALHATLQLVGNPTRTRHPGEVTPSLLTWRPVIKETKLSVSTSPRQS